MRALLASVLVVAMLTTGVAVSLADTSSDPLARAREAADSLQFSGEVTVRWIDTAGVSHTNDLHVQGGNGVIRLGGGPDLLAATDQQRWLFRHGEWDLVSPPSLPAAPPLDHKYAVSTTAGPDVAGRSTTLVALATNGHVRERLYLDADTGLLLRREQLDGNGSVVRMVGFESLDLDPGTAPARPVRSVDRQPDRVARVSAPYRAPSSLAGGYERTGMYRRNGAVQVVYSDGIHTLSVFEQQGRLDRHSLPDGAQSVDVGTARGVHLSWAGGEVVMWDAGQSTFTAVGDGTADEVVAAARSMPRPRGLTAWQRLRRACASIVDAVAG